MDADIYGPSGPLMMGLAGKPRVVDDKLVPLENHGVKLMSLGLLTGAEDAQVWRGSMVNSAVRQMLKDVAWGELDYLLVDMPPGTGDAQLTLVQQVPLTGAVVVSTPQAVALADVRKGVTMFRKVSVEILGVVENMSFFVCGECGTRHDIFASGGAAQEAERQGAPFLGCIPLRGDVREAGDAGTPLVAADPGSEVAEAFRAVAREVARQVARVALTTEAAAPTRLEV
jgi:ATP-binding protein involved in chromosome partitioning